MRPSPIDGIANSGRRHDDGSRGADKGVHEGNCEKIGGNIAPDLLRDVDRLPLAGEPRQDLDQPPQKTVARNEEEVEKQDGGEQAAGGNLGYSPRADPFDRLSRYRRRTTVRHAIEWFLTILAIISILFLGSPRLADDQVKEKPQGAGRLPDRELRPGRRVLHRAAAEGPIRQARGPARDPPARHRRGPDRLGGCRRHA